MDDRPMHQWNEVKERETGRWEERRLTRGGGLGTEHVWVFRVGLQVRVGRVFLQQGHLALPDRWRRAGRWVVGGRRGRREGWREQWRGRGWREGATWRMVGEKKIKEERRGRWAVRQNRWQWLTVKQAPLLRRYQTFILPAYWNFCCERLTMFWIFVAENVLCIYIRSVQPRSLRARIQVFCPTRQKML